MSLTFNATIREKSTKGALKNIRHQGQIPGVLYGGKNAPQVISTNHKEITDGLNKRSFYSGIHELNIDGKSQKVLVREVQTHPVTDKPIHIDFLRYSKDTKVLISVPLKITNQDKCPGLKMGGTLNKIVRSVDVICNPKDIPEFLEIDLINYNIGSKITIKNLDLPKDIRTKMSNNFPLLTINKSSGKAIIDTEEESDKEE